MTLKKGVYLDVHRGIAFLHSTNEHDHVSYFAAIEHSYKRIYLDVLGETAFLHNTIILKCKRR